MTDAFEEWRIDESTYPRSGTARERMRFLIRYAVLAPSGHNTQPWLFRLSGDGADLIADRLRCLPVVDPFDRALAISCGAALGHLCASMRFFGHEPVIDLLPAAGDPDLLARVSFGAPKTPSAIDGERFRALTRRRTTRRAYPDEPLPAGLKARLIAAAEAEGCELAVVDSREEKLALAGLVAEGDRAQFGDPAFRRELASWVHSRRSATRDGMSGAAFGMPDVLSAIGSLVIRTFDMGQGQGARDEEVAVGSPALLVLATPEDRPEHWLRAGMALSSILLDVTAAGWTSAYLNQPVEVHALRPRLGEAAGLTGFPQLLFRIGRAPLIDPAVRRPVSEVVIEADAAA